MEDLPDQQAGHTTKHARSSRNAADKAEIKYSAEVAKRFANLEAAVQGKGDFDSDVLMNLHHWATGKSGTVSLALGDMLMITRETMIHTQRTGNTEAKQALGELFQDLIGRGPDSPPIATVQDISEEPLSFGDLSGWALGEPLKMPETAQLRLCRAVIGVMSA
jgi:hypothetical protein